MQDLSKLADREKVWFLMDALVDAGEALRRYDPAGDRYIRYVKEMRGEPKASEHQEIAEVRT
jgi:hypothetical protein